MTAPLNIATSLGVLIAGLRRVGYTGARLETDYSFPDWFASQKLRTLDAAAFSQTPASYESACIAVTHANGQSGSVLVDNFRAFGAPLLLEVDTTEIREWEVASSKGEHRLVGAYPVAALPTVIDSRAEHWKAEPLMRLKTEASGSWERQASLFAGLIPELESEILGQLDPVLRKTVSLTRSAYLRSTNRKASPREVFRVVFWTLTAKVFHDRKVGGFATLDGDPDQILAAVAAQYGRPVPSPLNSAARETAASVVWDSLDFRNLSVEVLAHTWSRTLVDAEIKRNLGIHRTPRSIVKYIVDRVMPQAIGADEDLLVFEPCSGSAAFLIGAMNHMKTSLPLMSPQARHKYFVKHLAGIEDDPFGVEISMLALTLADFPNRNGWVIEDRDVFTQGAMSDKLRRTAVVLCNPPFGEFDEESRSRYKAMAIKKPAELIRRVLVDLHPRGVIGFVLPYSFVDGHQYRETRRLVAERFASIEITALPERSFEGSPTNIALLIATNPIPHSSCRVTFSRVSDSKEAWAKFDIAHSVTSVCADSVTPEQASRGLAFPELAETWRHLAGHATLSEFATVHRGIEWKQPATSPKHVRDSFAPGYVLGVPPKAKFSAFEVPPLKYLNVKDEDRLYLSYVNNDWTLPKAIVPKSRISRGHWRMVAFADRQGLCCYQTFFGVWPTGGYDEVVLAAIINSPLANAYVSSHEGDRDITKEVLKRLPMPALTTAQAATIRELVLKYESVRAGSFDDVDSELEALLKRIDAAVLDGYRLPVRLERELLDYFNNHERGVEHRFGPYYPADLESHFSLSQILRTGFMDANMGEMLRGIETR